jgi:hypothetical protein
VAEGFDLLRFLRLAATELAEVSKGHHSKSKRLFSWRTWRLERVKRAGGKDFLFLLYSVHCLLPFSLCATCPLELISVG